MARKKDREKALILRKNGKSYSQIKKILKVSKSTLSAWLKDYPLSEERIRELRDHNAQRIEKYCRTRRRKKEERLNKCFKEEKKIIFPINEKEIYLAGLFLYWGEGAKTRWVELALSNTDPAVIKFFIFWLTSSLKVPREKLTVRLHLYKDMDVNSEIKYWSKNLCFPVEQFKKSYIKNTLLKDINYKGGYGHGTCNLRVGNARLSEKVHMAMKAIAEKFNTMRV